MKYKVSLIRHVFPAIGLVLIVSGFLMMNNPKTPVAAEGADKAVVVSKVDTASMRGVIQHLSSKELGGRLTGTPEARIAAQWLADEFARMGLKPAGNNGTWFQEFTAKAFGDKVPFDCRKFTAATFRVNLPNGEDPVLPTVNAATGQPMVDPATGIPLQAKRQPVLGVDWGVAQTSKEVDLKNVEMVMKTDNAMQKYENKIVLITHLQGWGRHAGDPAMHQMVEQQEQLLALKSRALGAIEIVTPFGLPTINEFATLGDSVVISASSDVGQYLTAPGTTVDVVVAKEGAMAPCTGLNVLGRIEADPNSPYKNETVIVAGHYDGQGQKMGVILPSAGDDASGVAQTMEIAKAFKSSGAMPLRNLLVIAFGGEEQMLVGSRAYFESLTSEEKNNIKAFVNIDYMSGCADESGAGLYIYDWMTYNNPQLFDLLVSNGPEYGFNGPEGDYPKIMVDKEPPGANMTDARSISPGNIPFLNLGDDSPYCSTVIWRYHTAWDDLDNPEFNYHWMKKEVQVAAATVYDLAMKASPYNK